MPSEQVQKEEAARKALWRRVMTEYEKQLDADDEPHFVERALLRLLWAFAEEYLVSPVDAYLVKSFRQVDVVQIEGCGGHVDMAFWNLMQSDSVPIFWAVVTQVTRQEADVRDEGKTEKDA